jgi:hypothetical protein
MASSWTERARRNSRLEAVHRTGVAKHMRGHSLCRQPRTVRHRHVDVLFHEVGKPRAGQGFGAPVQEDLGDKRVTANGQPSAKCPSRLVPERETTLLPSFAPDEDARIQPIEFDVVEPEANQLRDPEARRKTEIEHRLVSDAASRAWVRCIQERPHLLLGQMVDEALRGSLARDRADSADLLERRLAPDAPGSHGPWERRDPRGRARQEASRVVR